MAQRTLDQQLHTLRAADAVRFNEAYDVIADGTIGHRQAWLTLGGLGVQTSETAIRRYRNQIQVTLQAPAPAPEEVEEAVADEESLEALQERLEALEGDNRRLFRQYAKAKAKGEEMVAAVYQAAFDAAKYVGVTPAIPPARDKRERPTEVALWHLTDWQGGKRTETYDRSVMHDRVRRFVDKAFDITEIQRADHPVREATLLFTGDMVEGVSIFPGQVWELDGTLFEQMFDVTDLTTWTIQQALSIYDSVQVVWEWGNHGRLGRKGDGIKASDNVDRMVGEIAKTRLAGESRITNFQVTGDWYQHFTIGNYRAMAIHGDEIKSFGGNLPAYGILRKANQWASGVLPTFQDLYIGHYHQSMQIQMANGGSVFMTGSPEIDNIYAAEFVAATGRPSQRLNFVNPDKGLVTAEYRIWLD